MPKFDKPTNKWIEEEIEVPSFEPVVNEKAGRVEYTQRMIKATRKTFYAESKPRKLICNDHFFYPEDKKKALFACNKCSYKKIAYPVTYRYNPETGKLTHRITHKKV